LRLYIESSVWNYLFVDHLPNEQAMTRAFIDRAAREEQLFISVLVGKELLATPDPSRRETGEALG
jgi:hypothetical protein